MQKEIVQALLEKVKGDYSKIASRFSDTRKNPWGEFELFKPYLSKGDRLLDLGCGNGRLSTFLKNSGVKYVGVDNNEEFLKLARALHPRSKFVLGDQTDIPFPDQSFDQIWNIAAFHHVPSQKLRMKALVEMKRILKPEGKLILTVWNLWQKKYRKHVYKSVLRNLIFGEFEYNDTFIPWGKEELVERYYHAFTMAELELLLKKAGFQIIDKFATRGARQVPPKESYNFCFICKKT